MKTTTTPTKATRSLFIACITAVPLLIGTMGCQSSHDSVAQTSPPTSPAPAPSYTPAKAPATTTTTTAAKAPTYSRTNGLIDHLGPVGTTHASGTDNPAGQAPGLPQSVVANWKSHGDFTFHSGSSDLSSDDMPQIARIADYMEQNPTAKIGIDGGSASSPDAIRTLSIRRTNSVRQALATAGVPNSRMEMGAFSNSASASDHRVEVLLHVGN